MDDMDPQDLEKDDQGFSYKSMLARDRRRWSVADRDGDDSLTRAEFIEFLHPEESAHMRDIVVAETLEDIDKGMSRQWRQKTRAKDILIDLFFFSLSLLLIGSDKDGKVSVEEYIGDMFRGAEDGEEEPEWVKNERETFANFRDKDHDGYMNNDEVRDWIIPPDFDHSEAEARHLIYEADSDADSKLTKDEILEKYDLFVGSQATDFGEALTRHDEF